MTVYSFITIDDPVATEGTFAEGINGKGQIVGAYRDGSGSHGFFDFGFYLTIDDPLVHNGGTYTILDDPLATAGTFAYGINATGQVVGFYGNNSGSHGFLYSGGSYTTLDDPLGINALVSTTTRAYGINDAGQIVGSYDDA